MTLWWSTRGASSEAIVCPFGNNLTTSYSYVSLQARRFLWRWNTWMQWNYKILLLSWDWRLQVLDYYLVFTFDIIIWIMIVVCGIIIIIIYEVLNCYYYYCKWFITFMLLYNGLDDSYCFVSTTVFANILFE